MGLYGKARVDGRRSSLKGSILRDVDPRSSEYSAVLSGSRNVLSTVSLIRSSTETSVIIAEMTVTASV